MRTKYKLAGWLSIVMTILFPLGFGVGLVQSIIGSIEFGYSGPNLGPSDAIFLIFTFMLVYVLIMLRDLLNEKYNFHEIDVLITVAIWWNLIFQVGGVFLKIYVIFYPPENELVIAIGGAIFLVMILIMGGIIDIFIAIKLLRIKESLNDVLRAYAYLTLISGICATSLILFPFALLMVPVSTIILALIFFKSKEPVEFV